MRLLHLYVERFGALVDRSFELDGAAFVLEGPNEAGKSSFHAAIETVLYGFQPATRDAHPYAAWGDVRHTLRLVALVELANGTRMQVERRLASVAGMRTAPEGAALEGPFEKNAPLAELQAIPRPLFRAVYSLTANEIAEPDDSGIQALIDELLLGDSGLVGMRPVRALRSALAEERARLWRSDNRGDPRDRQLQRQLAETRQALRRASDAERALAVDEEELARTQAALAAMRATLAALERDIEDADTLAELARLDRMSAALARVDLSGFDERADGTHAVLEDPRVVARAVAEAERALAAPRERLAQPARALSDTDRALLDERAAIEQLALEEADDRHERYEYDQIVDEIDGALRRAREGALGFAPALAAGVAEYGASLRASLSPDLSERDQAMFGGAPSGANPFANIPLEALATSAATWRSTREDAERDARHTRSTVWPLSSALAAGLALAACALAGRVTAMTGQIGLGVAGFAALGLALAGRPAARRVARTRAAPDALISVARACGLSEASLADPALLGEALEALEEARESLGVAEDFSARARARAAARHVRHERWRALASTVGLRALPSAAPQALRDALAAARTLAEAASRDAHERAVAQRELEAAAKRAARETERERRLHAALRRALPHQPDTVLAHEELRDLARQRSALEGEARALARRPRCAELQHDPRRAEGHGPCFFASELQAQRRERRDALAAERDAAQSLIGQLTERLRAGGGPAPAVLRARELELLDALKATRVEHDRLTLLERALVLGERRFRAAHQPDVLRVASDSLARITDGRYGRVDYPDPERRVLMVHATALGAHVPVGPPLSRGVREQVHLCLRLGTLEHLDRGREPLPLVLDEALVHWDPARRAALYPALRALTPRRQVIMMTCQPEHAAEAARALDARLVPLQRALGTLDQPLGAATVRPEAADGAASMATGAAQE
ncbi:MAG: AAA family ATPase [Planctomycetota bacterium]